MRKLLFIGVAILIGSLAQAKEYPEVTLEKLLSKFQLEILNVSKMSAVQKETIRMALINTGLQQNSWVNIGSGNPPIV